VRRPTVAVVGLGLVGGSIARALRRAGLRVIGVDRPAVLRRARAARAITVSRSDVREAAAEADVVVLAAPPAANRALLRRLVAFDGLVVTDVGSVKSPIVGEARRLGLRRFVGGHPIAGSEKEVLDAVRTAEVVRSPTWWPSSRTRTRWRWDGSPPRPGSAPVRTIGCSPCRRWRDS
jgi:prephenate dehydrogenase